MSYKFVLSIATLCFALFTAQAYAEQHFQSYTYPVTASRVSSSYGPRFHPVHKHRRHHSGVDLAAAEGAAIRAIQKGVVLFADYYAGYGNLITIAHKNGITSHYGHCKEIKVSIGDTVLPGEIIGTIGSTGVVTGPHLHFEIRKHGVPANPEKYISGLREKALG